MSVKKKTDLTHGAKFLSILMSGILMSPIGAQEGAVIDPNKAERPGGLLISRKAERVRATAFTPKSIEKIPVPNGWASEEWRNFLLHFEATVQGRQLITEYEHMIQSGRFNPYIVEDIEWLLGVDHKIAGSLYCVIVRRNNPDHIPSNDLGEEIDESDPMSLKALLNFQKHRMEVRARLAEIEAWEREWRLSTTTDRIAQSRKKRKDLSVQVENGLARLATNTPKKIVRLPDDIWEQLWTFNKSFAPITVSAEDLRRNISKMAREWRSLVDEEFLISISRILPLEWNDYARMLGPAVYVAAGDQQRLTEALNIVRLANPLEKPFQGVHSTPSRWGKGVELVRQLLGVEVLRKKLVDEDLFLLERDNFDREKHSLLKAISRFYEMPSNFLIYRNFFNGGRNGLSSQQKQAFTDAANYLRSFPWQYDYRRWISAAEIVLDFIPYETARKELIDSDRWNLNQQDNLNQLQKLFFARYDGLGALALPHDVSPSDIEALVPDSRSARAWVRRHRLTLEVKALSFLLRVPPERAFKFLSQTAIKTPPGNPVFSLEEKATANLLARFNLPELRQLNINLQGEIAKREEAVERAVRRSSEVFGQSQSQADETRAKLLQSSAFEDPLLDLLRGLQESVAILSGSDGKSPVEVSALRREYHRRHAQYEQKQSYIAEAFKVRSYLAPRGAWLYSTPQRGMATSLSSLFRRDEWTDYIGFELIAGDGVRAAQMAILKAQLYEGERWLPLRATSFGKDGEPFGPLVMLKLGQNIADATRTLRLFNALPSRVLNAPGFHRFLLSSWPELAREGQVAWVEPVEIGPRRWMLEVKWLTPKGYMPSDAVR